MNTIKIFDCVDCGVLRGVRVCDFAELELAEQLAPLGYTVRLRERDPNYFNVYPTSRVEELGGDLTKEPAFMVLRKYSDAVIVLEDGSVHCVPIDVFDLLFVERK